MAAMMGDGSGTALVRTQRFNHVVWARFNAPAHLSSPVYTFEGRNEHAHASRLVFSGIFLSYNSYILDVNACIPSSQARDVQEVERHNILQLPKVGRADTRDGVPALRRLCRPDPSVSALHLGARWVKHSR